MYIIMKGQIKINKKQVEDWKKEGDTKSKIW